MKYRQLALAFCAAALSFPALAAHLACPDLSAAVQVNACPTEDELKHTYNGYCSDDAKTYANQTDSCIRYDEYRRMKNQARWESKDGEFDGYVSCDLAPGKLATLKPAGMKIVQQGKITKVVCGYPDGINFTYRTKSACVIDNEKACAGDATRCTATCN